MAYTYSNLGSTTVDASGASVINFINIPQNYKDLMIKFSGRNASNVYTFSIKINGNTVTNSRRFYGTGSGAGASDTYNGHYTDYSTAAASTFGNAEIYFPNYTSSSYKSLCIDAVSEDNYASAYIDMASSIIADSNPIQLITLVPESGNFAQHTTATLYGIRAEL